MALKLKLFAPGMTMMHRCGLGGLAATLLAWEESGEVIPGKFTVDTDAITLDYKDPKKFFDALYKYAFQINQECIYFPGAWGGEVPDVMSLLFSTRGLLTVLLQNPQVKNNKPKYSLLPASPEFVKRANWVFKTTAADKTRAAFVLREITFYAHQKLAGTLISRNRLREDIEGIASTVAPGIMNMNSEISLAMGQRVDQAIALHFLAVGALYFQSYNSGVMTVLEVDNLLQFADFRKDLNPQQPEDFHVSSPAEASFGVRGRLGYGEHLKVESWKFQATQWAPKLKYRVATVTINSGKDSDAADAVMTYFPRYFTLVNEKAQSKNKTSVKKKTPAKEKSLTDTAYSFPSPLREFGLNNLAKGRPWFYDFNRLWTKVQSERGSDKFPFFFGEQEGIYRMMTSKWTSDNDRIFCEAIQESLGQANYKLSEKHDSAAVLAEARDALRCRLRHRFYGCRTAGDFEQILSDFFAKNGINHTLSSNFSLLNGMMCDPNQWEHARNLVLIAIAASAQRKVLKFESKEDMDRLITLNNAKNGDAINLDSEEDATPTWVLKTRNTGDAYKLAALAKENEISVLHQSR